MYARNNKNEIECWSYLSGFNCKRDETCVAIIISFFLFTGKKLIEFSFGESYYKVIFYNLLGISYLLIE